MIINQSNGECYFGHGSHVSTAAIEFCLQKKIILLCLPSHTTHLLQPLDVGVFAPLATTYKRLVQKGSRLGGFCAIDKIAFLHIPGLLPTHTAHRVQGQGSSTVYSALGKREVLVSQRFFRLNVSIIDLVLSQRYLSYTLLPNNGSLTSLCCASSTPRAVICQNMR